MVVSKYLLCAGFTAACRTGNPTNMIIPLITLAKIIALGSIKLVFLLLGIVFFPIFALRFILGGATGMLLPALDWLVEHGRLDAQRHKAIVDDLAELTDIALSRAEARQLLWKLVKKMAGNAQSSVTRSLVWIKQQIARLTG